MEESIDKRSWLILAMLFLFMLINFADKAVLGLSAGPIMAELKLSHTQFGQLGSSFFLLFSVSAVLVGFLTNRTPTKWTITAMGLVWALAQLPMALSVGAPLLIANRMVLGAGEGPAYPVALHALYKWFPDQRRPFPSSILSLGGAVGTGIAAPLITFVVLTYSWHAAFGLLGALGLAWVIAWLFLGKEGPLSVEGAHGPASGLERVPYLRLLTSRTVVGCGIVGFSAYWLLTLAVVWLPSYLHVGAGYAPTAVGWIVTLPSLVQILAIPPLCAFSERLKRRGVPSRICRGWIGAGSVALAGAMAMALPLAPGKVLPIVCATVAFAMGSTIFSMAAVLVSEVTPTAQRGAVLGINTATATLAGIFAPVTMGMIVDTGASSAEGFRTGFMIVGAAVMVAALIGAVLIDPEADIRRFMRLGDGRRPDPATGPTLTPQRSIP